MTIAYNVHNKKQWPDWAKIWARKGDDMACPQCGEEQVETHEHTTECLACGWKAENPVAILNDKG